MEEHGKGRRLEYRAALFWALGFFWLYSSSICIAWHCIWSPSPAGKPMNGLVSIYNFFLMWNM